MTIQDAAHIATIIATIATLGIGIWVYYRQMNAQIYLEYTKRYDQIMRDFPSEVRFNLEGALNDVDRVFVLRYLNLCSEEFYMQDAGYLSKRIWRIWEKEMERTLQSPLVLSEWEALRREFGSFEKFQTYVDKVQRGSF